MKITEEAPIEVGVYRSPIDGALVVQVDTQDDTGRIRITLNDGPIWDGDPDDGGNEIENDEIRKLRNDNARMAGLLAVAERQRDELRIEIDQLEVVRDELIEASREQNKEANHLSDLLAEAGVKLNSERRQRWYKAHEWRIDRDGDADAWWLEISMVADDGRASALVLSDVETLDLCRALVAEVDRGRVDYA